MKVLVAEDNLISQKVLVSYLEKMGFHVLKAATGIEAIDLWNQALPDFVLTDWNMPEGSGIDLVRHVRQNDALHYSYVILITSRENPSDLNEAFEAGVDDYLIKPVNRNELLLRMKAGERLLNLQSKALLVFAMAKLAETRDLDTGEHLERMRTFSKRIAEALAKTAKYKNVITDRFIKSLYDTSPLHDIGKVGIPDAILLKAGRLTESEFELMKTHTTLGVETLKAVAHMGQDSFFDMAIEITGAHHEKWDGSGYPNGLSGETIPLSARIVALADVYDALRSERIYKRAYSHEEAIRYIVSESGKHFDPDVVDAFLSIEREVKNEET